MKALPLLCILLLVNEALTSDTFDCNYIEGVEALLETTDHTEVKVVKVVTKEECPGECVKLRNSGNAKINGASFKIAGCFCQEHMIGTSANADSASCYLVKDAPTSEGTNGLIHDTNPTGSVTCNEAGFQPDFDLAFQAGTTVRWKVQIGDDASDSKCNSVDSSASGKDLDGIVVTDVTNDDIEYTAFTTADSFIPYASAAGADPTCKAASGTDTATLVQSADLITYKAKVRITVTETIRKVIERKRLYKFDLKCEMTRSVTDSSDASGGWTTSATLTPDEDRVADIDNTFDFPIALEVHPNQNMNHNQEQSFEKLMGEDMYVKMYEKTTNPLLKFKATRCFFTDTSSYEDTIKDVWFNECPVDKTAKIVTENTNTNDVFALKIQAFQFANPTDDSIFVHCDITLCLQGNTDDECVQKSQTQCNEGEPVRKRREIKNIQKEEEEPRLPRSTIDSGIVEHRQLTVEKPILIGMTQVITPTCATNFVYDRVSRKCSSENILQVEGVYLDIAWKEELANPSSQEFQDFAQSVGYQLYSLMQYANDGIRGVKVIAAREGSVILTIQVIYSSTMDDSEAQNIVEEGIRGTAQTRLAQLLMIRPEKIMRYVVLQPSRAAAGLDQIHVIIIVVVAVLVTVLFISAMTIWRVTKRRVNNVEAPPVKSYDNNLDL